VIPHNSSFSSVREISFFGNHTQNYSLVSHPVEWLYNYDVANTSENSFKIYQGHHGDIGASISDVVLPSTSFIEKTSFYSNIFGMVQKTKKVLFSVGDSRDD
jgi:NADH dehydrogenase/NADH:ubiquinone oxidoreductase subunit G